MKKNTFLFTCILVLVNLLTGGYAKAQSIINMKFMGRYNTGIFDKGATEIAAFDPLNARLFSVNGSTGDVDVLSLADPTNPVLIGTIDLSPYGAGANSVDFRNGVLVVAVEATVKQDSGRAVFFTSNGVLLKQVVVGALPDMITYTPDGNKVLVANEGEPSTNYVNDPNGTVSIIDVSAGISALNQSMVTTLDFSVYNGTSIPGVRVYGKNATFSQDMEPEYIAVSPDSKTAWVTLQENNALAAIDLTTKSILWVRALGFKNYNLPGNGIDATDRTTVPIKITNWPVYGMYQPDAITAFTVNGNTYTILANEGDVREYDSLNEVKRVSTLALDGTAFTNASTLKLDTNIGRLNVTSMNGDTDNDGDYDELYSFGSRSFSIRDVNGNLVYDSGDFLEQYTASLFASNFNASNTNNNLKNRSDDKGPEPEGVTVAYILDSVFAFVGLERMGGIMVFNITNPASPVLVDYINTRNLSQIPAANAGGDLAPEGLLFIPRSSSPNGNNLLVASYEVSGTISVYETDITCEDKKVLVCLYGNTMCVNKNAIAGLLSAGATLGPCSTARSAQSIAAGIFNYGSYPNPASNSLNITMQGLIEDVTIQLFSGDGRILDEQLVAAGQGAEVLRATFDVSILPAGFYFYRITSPTQQLGTGKFIISRL